MNIADISPDLASTPEPNELVTRIPTPNDPPWTSGVATAVWIISVVLILFVPSFFLLPYLATLDSPITDNAALMEFAKNDPTAILLQVIAIIPVHLLTLLIAWVVVTKGWRYSFLETLGWESGETRWWHYAGFLFGFLILAVTVGYFVPEQDNDLLRILRSSRAVVYIVVILATFTAPLVEEVVYRGMLYSAFQRSMGVPAAFLLVTLLFALVHVPQYYPSYSTIFLLTLLSVGLTGLRVWSGNLLPCVILHMLFNGIQSIFILIGPSTPNSLEQPVGTIIHFLK